MLASASVLLNSAGPAAAQGVVLPDQDDPSNIIYSVDIDKDGSLGKLGKTSIPDRGFYTTPPDRTIKKDFVQQPKDLPKLQPELEQLLASGDPSDSVSLLIGLREDTTIPRFPDLPYGESRESSIAEDLGAQQERLAADLLSRRRKSQAALLARVQDGAKLQLKEQFWLINGFVAELPLAQVKNLLQFDEVEYVQLQAAGEKPPADANPNNDVADGRSRIVSDPYFNLSNMAGGFVGLLDTGVRTSHTTFAASGGDHIDFLRDCVNGGSTCNNTSAPGFNTDDNCWNHGTSTASIFTGNANQGSDFRGVTAITLDSWKVYNCVGLDSVATVRGFQAGLLAFDRVFIGELQASESESGAIATAADNAFDAGAVVIAANGNFGPGASTVRSPAIAHKVIGVGGYDVETLTTLGSQGRGPATDGRFKPDIQTPSLTETASTASATAQHIFTGTSGATPYAAGAGALTRNFMRNFSLIEPGHVYARMIQSGQHVWPYDNEEGAGDLKMPTCGTAFWGKVNVNSTGSVVDIPLSVGASRNGIEAAIWWPERVTESHDDIDVHLIDPFGVERAKGFSAMSIFERARVSGALTTGTWTIRIKGFSVASGPQPVFWSLSLKGC
ncbi:MAG TPA: S8 family serine peptidase [Chloroflexota bacterium]|nr:S8 family serine peptidase [Chloroflexota bacterium]